MVNDPNESEFGIPAQVVFSSEFELNPQGAFLGVGTSPWDFRSNGPARIHPTASIIPEVSSLWMLGMGLGSFGVFRRRKLI